MERGVSVLSTRNADLPRKTQVGSITKSSYNGNGKDDQSVFKQGMLVFVHHDVDIWTEGTVSGIDEENILVTLPSGKEQWVKHKDIALRNECDYASTEDLTLLTPLTCASVFQCLKKRYQQDVFYTRAGVTLVAINPFKEVPSLYKKKVIDRYHQLHGQRKVLSPHVFAIAQEAYSHMRQQVGRMNQSVIVSGESGSGKTVTAKHLMKYLTSISNSNAGDTGTRIESRILDSNPILEAFGNASTSRNSNSSRFGKYIQLQFQRNGQILGASIQTYLLEKTRVVHQAENERNFHIFYQMLNGGNDVEKEEWLGRKDSLFKMITNHGACTEDQQSWRQTREAMEDIGITAQQQDSIFKVKLNG
ncbi:unconventional myosin-XIX-like [Lingula anatina]|uniref:Unconventional myosin-XIX-like n=1 Tax=Lingula anatina TaxID=7574 RepID=A0A1S3JCU9_LINAN|nr:unconventional myosin-XIX-like [Lingula anatina]|eukprot:XP_013408148.1 unconventional myosin-XIX-like [Lingula anatina]